jgi:hypothetical protein
VHFNVNFKYVLVFSKTNKYVHQSVNINTYIKMHCATINTQIVTQVQYFHIILSESFFVLSLDLIEILKLVCLNEFVTHLIKTFFFQNIAVSLKILKCATNFVVNTIFMRFFYRVHHISPVW